MYVIMVSSETSYASFDLRLSDVFGPRISANESRFGTSGIACLLFNVRRVYTPASRLTFSVMVVIYVKMVM